MISRWRVCDIFAINYRWLEPCAVKVARTVPTGGKFAKTYLSEFELINFILSLSDVFANPEGLAICLAPSLILAKDKNINTKKHSSIHNKGYIRRDGKLIQIPLKELETLIENHKQRAKKAVLSNAFTSEFLLSLRSLVNGIFQAEGSWSGQFISSSSHRFVPKFSIGQNVSEESLYLFSLIWAVLGCQLVWSVSRTQAGNYHIQLRSTNKKYIETILIPYFSLTYGEKYMAGAKLLLIATLQLSTTLSSQVEAIKLAYSLAPDGLSRNISLEDKLLLVAQKASEAQSGGSLAVAVQGGIRKSLSSGSSSLFTATENSEPLNFEFILGFFLGDGSLYIRIRDKVTGLLFIPKFEIKQKNTPNNLHLMRKVCDFLNSKGVIACLRTDLYYVLCVVEGIDNLQKLLLLLEPYQGLFF
jgi:hypothetical protein